MSGRLWTALLLLAAVLGAHGVQCSAAASDPALAHTIAHITALEVSGLSPAGDGTAPTSASGPAASRTDFDVAPVGPALDAATVALLGTGHGPGHDTATHLWTLCLAVLAAG